MAPPSNWARKPAASITYVGISTPEKGSLSDPGETAFVPGVVLRELGGPPFVPMGGPPAPADASPVTEFPSEPGAVIAAPGDVAPEAAAFSSSEDDSPVNEGNGLLAGGDNGSVRVESRIGAVARSVLSCRIGVSWRGDACIVVSPTSMGRKDFG